MILNDDVFARIVAEDVKNRASADKKSYLRSADVAPRWRETLYHLLGNLDGQIGLIDDDEKGELSRVSKMPDSKRMEFETREKHEDKRSKIKRFRFHVEQRLAEADRLILLADGELDDDSAESFLRKAIEKHYELMTEFDMEPNPIDDALYDAVRGMWSFGDIDPADFE